VKNALMDIFLSFRLPVPPSLPKAIGNRQQAIVKNALMDIFPSIMEKESQTKPLAIPDEVIMNKIYFIRGQKVMIDSDLSELYGVETRRLNEQVKRNISRFPEDFMFQLSEDEFDNLISQFATSSWGGRRRLPYVFTEHGVLMLSSVLNK
jgi:hypothetical protein